MNECVVTDNTIKWHYTITSFLQIKMKEMNETKLQWPKTHYIIYYASYSKL